MHSAQSAKSVQPVKPTPRTPTTRSPHPDRHAQVDDLFPYTDRSERDFEEERVILAELSYMGIRLNDD